MTESSAVVSAAQSPTVPSFPRVPMAQIVPSKTNPRKHFDPAFLAELAGSMKKHGFFGAILARPHPSKPGAFEIVAGEQRYRAAREAGLAGIPVDVRAMTDDEALEIQVVENLTRRDLSAMEEADGYNVLLTKKYTHERIAERVGRSVDYVRDRCRLLRLIKPAAEFLHARLIEVGHALELAKLSPEHQARAIRFEGGGLWERQRSLQTTSEERAAHSQKGSNRAHDLLLTVVDREFKPVTVKELRGWIAYHCRLDVKQPENRFLFPTIAAAVEPVTSVLESIGAGPKPRKKVIQITWDFMSSDDIRKEKGERIFTNRSWTRADGRFGSKTCAQSVMGAVVAGTRDYGQAFDVCIAKKTCQVHYKREIAETAKREAGVARSGKTGRDRFELEEKRRKAEEEKQKLDAARFAKARPALLNRLADRILAMPTKADGLLAKIVAGEIIRRSSRVSELSGYVPRGRTSEDLLRHLAFLLVGTSAFYYNAGPEFARLAKPFGVPVDKIVEAANASDKAQAPASTKKGKAKR